MLKQGKACLRYCVYLINDTTTTLPFSPPLSPLFANPPLISIARSDVVPSYDFIITYYAV